MRLGALASSPRGGIPIEDEKYNEDHGARRGKHREDNDGGQNAAFVELALDE